MEKRGVGKGTLALAFPHGNGKSKSG